MQDKEQTPSRTDVNELGEFGLIEHLTRDFPHLQESTVKGVGDDAAVLSYCGKKGPHTLVSTDSLIEGIHFDLSYTPLMHLGYKAVIVNLSDIYAMNAHPTQITFSFGISNRFSVEAMEEIYKGVRKACELYKVDLVGGDTTSSPRGLVLQVTALGKAFPDKIAYRSGAKEGDIICITGNLGAAYVGLQILEREKQVQLAAPGAKAELEQYSYLIERQLKPEARKDMIRFFEKSGLKPTSMIDISDGLASDLFHICRQSGLGAYLEESGIPMHPDMEMAALDLKLPPLTCALSGGEDYELLFTIDPGDLNKVKFLPDIYIAGEMVSKKDGLTLHTTGGKVVPLKAQGWQHFGKED